MPTDDIDPRAARRLAWTFGLDARQAAEALTAEPPGPAVPEPAGEEPSFDRREELDDETRQALVALMVDLTRLERMPPPVKVKHVRALVEEAQGLLRHLEWLSPDDGTRLAHFLLVQYARLDPVTGAMAAELMAHCASLDSDHYPRYLLALISDGHETLCQAEAARLDPAQAPFTELSRPLGPRLHALLRDPAISEEGKVLALLALQCGRWRAERDALVAALHEDCWLLRQRAVDHLFRAALLRAEDLDFILVEGLEGRVPSLLELDERFDVEGFHATLHDAIGALRTPFLAMRLTDLASGYSTLGSQLLKPAWAVRALAAAFPAEALSPIDERLAFFGLWYREQVLPALELLPLELALPRLQLAATDPVPAIALGASALLARRTGQPFLVDPLDVTPLKLLGRTPGMALRQQFLLVRDGTPERRLKLRDLLLRQARDGRGSRAGALMLVTLLADPAMQEGAPEVEGVHDPFVRWVISLPEKRRLSPSWSFRRLLAP